MVLVASVKCEASIITLGLSYCSRDFLGNAMLLLLLATSFHRQNNVPKI